MISSRESAAAAGPHRQLRGDARRDVVEVGPASLEQRQASIKFRRGEHLALDRRRHAGDAPELGRARAGDTLDHLEVGGTRELVSQAGSSGDIGPATSSASSLAIVR
jgi:hypothetical protein